MEALEPLDARLSAGAAERASLDERLAAGHGRAGRRRGRRRRRDHRRPVRPAATAAVPIPASLLERYERLRVALDGVAVATLDGPRCTGCNLTLPIAELERVRLAGPDDDHRVRAVRPDPRAVSDVLLWFWGTAFLTVWAVFHDPSIDYRFLLARLDPAGPDRRALRRAPRSPTPSPSRWWCWSWSCWPRSVAGPCGAGSWRCRSACSCTSCSTARSPTPRCSGGPSAALTLGEQQLPVGGPGRAERAARAGRAGHAGVGVAALRPRRPRVAAGSSGAPATSRRRMAQSV